MSDERDTPGWKYDLGLLREVHRETSNRETINVLVVEDCDEDFFLITRCLNAMKDFDVSVTRAADRVEASRMVSKKAFDLAIVDYWLGTDTGPHVLRQLGGRHGRIPAILLTGLDHPAYKRAGLKAGAIQCMSKCALSGIALQDAIVSTLATHRIEAGEA